MTGGRTSYRVTLPKGAVLRVEAFPRRVEMVLDVPEPVLALLPAGVAEFLAHQFTPMQAQQASEAFEAVSEALQLAAWAAGEPGGAS